jgi:hypothetical protein
MAEVTVKRMYTSVDHVEPSVSRNGNAYYKVFCDGELFFVWDKSIIDDNDIAGDTVAVYFEQKGNFKTIKSLFKPHTKL